ncbi:MAG: hypothetical protein K9G30_05435 [Parvibaculum sp.]|nr:hypothetical protein [Parvibaculum sp.]
MTIRLLILAAFAVLGLAAPAAAGEVRWIDPWAPYGESAALAGGPVGECHCAERPVLTGLAGFTGGVGNRQTIFIIPNGFYFNPSLPAGQVPMTGARARPVHPLGTPFRRR